MIVVSDTSPIRALAQLGLLDTLSTLFGEVLVPPGVVDELAVVAPGVHAVDITRVKGVRVESPTNQATVSLLLRTLGRGEAEAIALAVERGAGTLLIGDWRGRRAAESRGLLALGVLAVLVRCKRQGLIPRVTPLINRLRDEIDFRTSPQVRETILRLAGESEDTDAG